MKLKILLLILFVALVWNRGAISQTEWKLSGQIRHRFEASDKTFDKDQKYNNFNLLRSRLNITLIPLEDVIAFFQFQDSRVFGEELSTLTDGSADNMDLHQGYFLIRNLFNKPLDLKVGRMEVIYGPERLMGAVGWHNIGRSFDGAILKYRKENAWVDIFNLKQIEKMKDGNDGDLNVLGAYGEVELSPDQTGQAFFIWQRGVPARNLSRYTAGFYNTGKSGDFRYELEAAYQGGKLNNMDVRAFMLAGRFGYTFAGAKIKPNVTIGVDYLSGDDDPTDKTYKVFNTLYATNHKYYGYMDYFTNIPQHTLGLGLIDALVRFSIKPFSRNMFKLDIHKFNASQRYTLADGSTSKSFGTEIDLTWKYAYNPATTLTAGASLFTPGDIFKETRGDNTSTWFYLMTTVNF